MSFQYASNVYWHYIHNYSETSQKACNISLLGKKKMIRRNSMKKKHQYVDKKEKHPKSNNYIWKKKFWYLHADKNVGSNI